MLESRAAETTSRSSTTHFSAEARAISRILEKFPASAPVISTSTVMLPAGRAPEVAVLAATLAGQIRYSGLFYESHLRQWLVGQHDQQALMKEPQNRPVAPSATGARLPLGAGGQEPLMLATRERAAVPSGDSTSPQTQSGNAASMSPAQDDLQSILRHQLELMTHSLVRWEGFLTPQVPVHWEIEQGPETAIDDNESSRVWRSRLKLSLPELGPVDLEVSLQNKTISINGSVEGPYLAWMTIQGRHLDERMAGAGLQLAALHFSPQNRDGHGEEAI
ncbi:hook-length control protein FliK [Kushneria avicenniae]|uniref:Hook-length control protein FliK n=2 Tax=Kushneria avicenniae TaxID=402385 RepID=A0A1I1FCS2_9GAMM|nr:hook-length control protein FliK [Kushneria avicenniae]